MALICPQTGIRRGFELVLGTKMRLLWPTRPSPMRSLIGFIYLSISSFWRLTCLSASALGDRLEMELTLIDYSRVILASGLSGAPADAT